nr:MAG TPA: hypothetical protein [Caudoviricetes sp.]
MTAFSLGKCRIDPVTSFRCKRSKPVPLWGHTGGFYGYRCH